MPKVSYFLGKIGLVFVAYIAQVTILIVVGVLLWLVNNYIPMDAKIKNILNIVVVIAVVALEDWIRNVMTTPMPK